MKAKSLLVVFLLASSVLAAEKPVKFVPARADALVGDWKGNGNIVAQVVSTDDGKYQASLLGAFDANDKPLAVLQGGRAGDSINLTGDGWIATIDQSHFKVTKGAESIDLQHITRTSPTLGAPPPVGAVVLFDGKNLDAWAKKAGKNWLSEDGPARWKLTEGDGVEVVPGADSLITHQKFGDCRFHVEFRTLGAPTNSGVYIQTRYEVNINESYGRPDVGANGALGNCTQDVRPAVRATLPPLAWQTYDIDFQAPRFDAAGKKIANARVTVLLNGVKIYDNQELDPPHGAASRLGEAPKGPLMLQDHGAPLQFRNIWLVEASTGKN